MKSVNSIALAAALFFVATIFPTCASAQNELNGRLIGTVTKSNGKTIYLSEQFDLGVYSIAAYAKENGKYVPIEAFKVKKNYQSVIKSVKYVSWYGSNSDEGFFAFNKADNTLYIPLIDEDLRGFDRYIIYKFDGNHFIYKGKGCGYWLHPSLGDYEYLYALGRTTDYLVRIDKMQDGSLRYASWRSNKTMKDKPNIILYGDEFFLEKDGLEFYNEDYLYVFNHELRELFVYKDGKLIKRQKLEILFW